MTKIHAVIYVNEHNGFIAMGSWQDPKKDGVSELVRMPAGPATDEEEVLDQLRELAETTDSLADTHLIVPDTGALPIAKQMPRLLIFRFDGRNWVARGFEPWGGIMGTGTNQVFVLAGDSDDPESDGYIWRRKVADILFALRGGGAAAQAALGIVAMEEAEGSIAFRDDTAIGGATGNANAADFGNAADSIE